MFKPQVLSKHGHSYVIQVHFRQTGCCSLSFLGATHQHEGAEACEEHKNPIMGLQD